MTFDKDKEQFFSLLRAGLWINQSPSVLLFDEKTDWNAILELSIQQTVVAIVWDGLIKLPESLQPPRAIKLKWYSYVVKIEQSNELINRRLVQIVNSYKQNGINPILLKGAGVAYYYENPLHRSCGDIDLYVGIDGYQVANETVVALGGTNFLSDCEHHSHATLNGVVIENHRLMAVLFTPTQNRRFNLALSDWYPKDSVALSIDDFLVDVPPLEFNAQFVFLHLYRHFIEGGVGLRQLCDWAILMDKIECPQRCHLISSKQSWLTLGGILVNYLGLPTDKLPYYSFKKDAKIKRTMELILDDGNFGFNDTTRFTKRPKSYIAGKLFSFRLQIKRWRRLFSILPSDTLKYLFFYKFIASFKMFMRELISN